MFWGLTIEPGKHYTQTVEESFHVSMAALETRDHVAESSSEKTGVVQVIIKHEKTEFLVCSLFYGTVFQQRVDLNFTEGEEVTFCTEGRGTVHLTGYLVKEEYLDTDPDMMSLEDASSSDEVSVSSGDEDDADISLQQLAQADMEDDDSEEDDWSPSAARGGGYPPGKRVKRKKLKKGAEEEGSPEKDSPSKRKRDGSGDADFAMMYQPPMRKSAKKARKTMAIAMAAKQDAAEESNEEGEDGKPEKINQGLMEGIIEADHEEDVPVKEQSKKTTAEVKAIVIADDDDDTDIVQGKKQSKKASVENKEIVIADDDDDDEEEDDDDDDDYVPGKKTKVKSKGKSPGKEDTQKQKRKEGQDDLEEESETDDSEDEDYEEEDSEDEDFDSEDEEDDSEDEEDEEEDDDVKEVVPNGKAPKGKEGKKGKKDKNAAKADKLAAHSSPEKEPAKKEQQKKKKPDKTGGDNKENVSSRNGKEKEANQEKETPKKEQKKKLLKTTLKGGIKVQDTVEGQGKVAITGSMVHVYYKGRLQSNNKQFDACMSGQPFSFRLGKGEVIKGWDVGVAGMKVGGKRQIIVPPSQGYGNTKTGPIPANSTLIFEVELKKVK